MPFGAQNAPAIFQRLVNRVLSGLPRQYGLCSSTWAEHLDQIKEPFELLEKANLTIKPAKYEFGKARVTYLGKIVGRWQVYSIQAKVEAVCNFSVPANFLELQRFLGMASYYRVFCRNATVVALLTDLISSKVPSQWSEASEQAFDNTTALLVQAPVLIAPRFDKCFSVSVDASDRRAGAVLLQTGPDRVEHPVCYFSKTFNRH